jgi:hypothetical protein
MIYPITLRRTLFLMGGLGLVINLLIAACNNTSGKPTANPFESEAANTRITTTTQPTATISTLAVETPEPANTSTTPPLSLPTATAIPLPLFVQNQQQLGVNWGSGASTEIFVGSSNSTDPPVMVISHYSPNRGITAVNARSGQPIFEWFTDTEDSIPYDIFNNVRKRSVGNDIVSKMRSRKQGRSR